MATKNAPGVRLPLEFMVAGIFGFLALQALLLLHGGEIFRGAYLQPGVVATVHLATLGWGTMVVLGAYYQLVPVLLQVDLHSERLGHAAFWSYLTGSILLIGGFWAWAPPAMAGGGLLILAALLLFTVNMALTLRRIPRRNLQSVAMTTALCLLVLTVAIGLVMVFNFIYGFLPSPATNYLGLHLIAGIGGWFTLTIIAVGYRLIPMFTLSHGYPENWQRPVAFLTTAGITTSATAVIFGTTGFRLLAAALPLAAGLLLFAADLVRIIKHRRRRRLELVTQFTVASASAMVLAVVLAAILLIAPEVFPASPAAAATAAAYLFVMGWVSLIIIGQLYKVVPFLIWLHRYADRAGKESVPLVSDLYSPELGKWSLRLILAGIFGTPLAVVAGLPELAMATQALALAGTILFTSAMIQVLLGLRQIPRNQRQLAGQPS